MNLLSQNLSRRLWTVEGLEAKLELVEEKAEANLRLVEEKAEVDRERLATLEKAEAKRSRKRDRKVRNCRA